MIYSIMQIGKRLKHGGGSEALIHIFTENPNEKGNIHKVVTINLAMKKNSYVFDVIDVEEFRQKRIQRYLYRRGSSRGADITPTSKYAGDMEKTFKNKIIRSIQNIKQSGNEIGFSLDELDEVDLIEKALVNKADTITEQLTEKASEFDRGEGAIVTLVFRKDDERHYIGDLSLFQKALIAKSKENYFKQYGEEARGYNQFCSVCLEKQKEVFGFANTYNFYTVDKPGFVTGGFRRQDAWKNYPVCFECATSLELGKKYLNENLNFDFYGFRYLMIPKFIGDQVVDEVFDVLEDALDHRAGTMIQPNFGNQFVNCLTNAENEIFDLLSGQPDYMSFDLMFYAEKQAAFNILLHVEDVFPSRLRKLFQIKKRLDNLDIFKRERQEEVAKRNVVFNLGILRRFFLDTQNNLSLQTYFLEISGKIFSLKPIDYDFIIRAVTNKLRILFRKAMGTRTDGLNGYLLLNFLSEAGILYRGGERMTMQLIEDIGDDFFDQKKSVSDKIQHFFKAHISFFDSAEKKACFLVGVLVQYLLNEQIKKQKKQIERSGASSTQSRNIKPPFRKQLHGLKLNESLVKKIAFEAQEKLEQYQKNHYYRELETVISQYMVLAGSKWKATNDELAFYLTMGMNLAKLFKTGKGQNSQEGENNERADQ